VGFFSRFKNVTTGARYQMIVEKGNGYYAWNGKLYQSDIVRACIRPRVKAAGKLIAKHVRKTVLQDGTKKIDINPEPYMRFLLEEPNPYMTGQMLQEKVTTQLALNNNAFILIMRDDFGYPCELYPIPCAMVEAIYDKSFELYLKFTMLNGKTLTVPYTEVIHLRDDFNNNDIFGDPPGEALTSLMSIVITIDQGIIKAIKNSNVIKWLLKFNNALKPEAIKQQTKEFVESFLNTETSQSAGAAGVDTKAEAIQLDPKDYVPNAAQMDRTTQRIYSFFNTNDKIVQSKYTEDEWISYYEARIEPDAMQFSGEYTRKLFSRRERGFGNQIIFEASALQYASLSTKLGLVQMVDRGAMVVNEWRDFMNLAPLPDGDVPIRRLDTAVVNQLVKKMDGSNYKEICNVLLTMIGGENNAKEDKC
jgi:HK97 family phage portal protein